MSRYLKAGRGQRVKCGCRPHPSGRGLVACEMHWVQAHFGFFHGPDMHHKDCCDVPQMQKLVEDYGAETVEAAVVDEGSAYCQTVWDAATAPPFQVAGGSP